MFGLGRRKPPAPAGNDEPAGTVRAVQTGAPAAYPQHAHRNGGTTGWAPMPGAANPSQQVGMFAGQLLTQYPTNVPGVQLKNGREGASSRWYYPTATYAPLGNIGQTPRPGVISGGQRFGSIYSGPMGPIQAQELKQQVAIAQVRQSGMAALDWAAALQDQ